MPKKKTPLRYSILSALFLGFIAFFLVRGVFRLDYDWDFKVLLPYLWQSETGTPGLILQGLWQTIRISVISIAVGTFLGVFLGALFVGEEPIARKAVLVYVDILRNTPVLVQLYVAYFVIGSALGLDADQAGILTLSAFCAAFVADLVRGTWSNFEKGQVDAAKSLGMTYAQIGWHVVFPPMLRRMLPALVGQFVTLVKDSALVSVLGVPELTKAALNVIAGSFRSFETWFFIASIYLVLNLVLSSFGRYLEHRLSVSLR